MGRATSEPSDQASVTHFSHPHPLNLSNNPQNSHCSACKLDASGPVYTCISCNFFLHPKCYKLPQQITHPCHNNHTLTLHSKPVYPEGIFNCDACANKGDGFSYRCDPCGVDLHTTCSMLPLEFSHQCHHHPLSLTFVAPYPGNTFSCDVCKRVGSKSWIYRCNVCEFDVHLTCVASIIPVARVHQQSHVFTSRSVQPPLNHVNSGNYMAANYGSRPVVMGQQQNQFPVMGNYPPGVAQMNTMPYNNLNQPVYYNNGGIRPVNGGIMDHVAGGVANGVASAVAQTLLGGLGVAAVGGGGGGILMEGGAFMDGGADGGYSGGDGSV